MTDSRKENEHMNARDKLLRLIDEGLLNADDILRDLLVNYFDIDTANDAAESELIDNGFDDELDENN